MAKRDWTPSQSMAFEAESGDLLVCAAAGSGKSTVLTERVIRSLSAEPSVDITRMLIVTFTKAAAGELKAKISKAITEKMGEKQGDHNLQKQLLLMDRAKICTIDSFFKNLISGYFTELGLPASPRTGDDAEVALLQNQTMESLLDRLYEEESPDFLRLVRCLARLRDNNLTDLFLNIYKTVSSYPEGVEYVRDAAQKLRETAEKGIAGSDFGRQTDRVLIRTITHYRDRMRPLLDDLPGDDRPEGVAIFQREFAVMDQILNCSDPAERARLIRGLEFSDLPKGKSKKSLAYEALQAFRNEYRPLIKALKNDYFSESESDQKIAADRSADLCTALYKLLRRFEEAYAAEKKRIGMLDFADVAHYAHKLLIKDGQPTAVARNVAASYDQIYIDEYQDVNRLQDEIFSAISRGNRFMVGDIKQSIYCFRGAVPDLFAGYREAFPDYDPENPGEQGRIFLSHNFRSSWPIMKFVNAVFDRLFVNSSGRVPYVSDSDALRLPKGKDDTGAPVRLALIRGKHGENDPEAVWVADRIAEQIAAGRRPSEIAILLRSPKTVGKVFEDELHKRGIPTESSVDEDFFDRPEILLILALLGAIDNPRRDVYLAGAMKSPIFGITLEELILLKKKHPASCLYDSLTLAAESGDFPKCTAFFTTLNELREDSRLTSVDKLIRKIYRITSLPALVGGNPDCGRAGADRLCRFYAFAHAFESGSFRGLHNFMRYIGDIRKGELSPTIEKRGEDRNCVHILSIHQSKGLEYPVVYLCRTDVSANLRDLGNALLLQREMGIAFRLRDSGGYGSYDPVLRKAVRERMREDMLDEEMRNLYVALTRPKEELYVTACVSDFGKADAMLDAAERLDFYSITKHYSYLYWILAALGKNNPVCEIEYFDPESADSGDAAGKNGEIGAKGDADTSQEGPEGDAEVDPVLREELSARLNYVYPHQAEVSIPSKAVVSGLYPSYLDETEDSEVRYRFRAKPAFLEPLTEPTGAERGTATHLFMQFCDFAAVKAHGVQAELARLVDRGFITRDQATMVYADKLSAFFASPLFRQMSESPELHREYRFLLSKPAGEFTEDPERAEQIAKARLLVQGVIDCFFLLPDGSYKLVDYKTDRIRGKSDPEQAAEALAQEYGNQLRYYREAIEQLSGKKVSQTVIYAFDLSREIVISQK